MNREDRIVLDQASIALGSQVFFEKLDWSLKAGEHWVISGNAGVGKTFQHHLTEQHLSGLPAGQFDALQIE